MLSTQSFDNNSNTFTPPNSIATQSRAKAITFLKSKEACHACTAIGAMKWCVCCSFGNGI
jgi:hypothetical protein